MLRRDLSKVIEIENACYKIPWTEGDFVKAMTRMGMLGFVITDDDGETVKGFMVYHVLRGVDEGEDSVIYLRNLAIGPLDQRKGLGKELLGKLKYKAAVAKCRSIQAIVHEGNLPAQLWLKENGFIGYKVKKGFFGDGSDGYCFKYELEDTCGSVS